MIGVKLWTSVWVRMPPAGRDVIVRDDGIEKVASVIMVHFADESGVKFYARRKCLTNVTHWRPLGPKLEVKR